MQQLAYFLDKLRATPDGDGSLRDHMTILYGGGISDSNLHTHDNRGGRRVRCEKDTLLANLQLTLLNTLGVPVDNLGDSTGQRELVAGV